jgi:hypothetical protein
MSDWFSKELNQMARAVTPELPVIRGGAANDAEWMYKRLVEFIKDFEAQLDDDHEIGARLVSFGQNVTFHIDDMGYYGPDIITFYGKNESQQYVQLIQHISQLSVLLVAMEKVADKPRRIGFALWEKLDTKPAE